MGFIFGTIIPRVFSQARTAISICVVTGIPSVSFTPRIAFSSAGSSRKAAVVFIVFTSINMYIRFVNSFPAAASANLRPKILPACSRKAVHYGGTAVTVVNKGSIR